MRGIKIFTTHMLWLNQWSLKTGPRPARTWKFLSRAELGVFRHCWTVLRCHWNTGNYLTISCWHIETIQNFPFYPALWAWAQWWFPTDSWVRSLFVLLCNLYEFWAFWEESLTRRHNVQSIVGSDGSSSDTLGLLHSNWSKVLSLLLNI